MAAVKSKTIKEHVYEVKPFTGRRALTLFNRVVKFGAPALGALTSMDPDTDINLVPVAQALATSIDEGTADLVFELMTNTHRDHIELNEKGFDEAYRANLAELMEALLFVLEVNFGDFFGEEVRAVIGAALLQSNAA